MTSSTDTAVRRAHSVPSLPTARRHRGQVARWALANGHPVQRDALAAIVAVRLDASTATIELRWTLADVERVLWGLAPAWCASQQVAVPDGLAVTLGTYLRYLSAHRLLGPGSDPIAALRHAATEQQSGAQRSRARHPAAGRPAPVLPIC